jgi:outer membrane lipoprotein-sorting protein
MTRLLQTILLSTCLVCFTGSAQAEAPTTGADWLTAIDAATSPYADAYIVLEVTVQSRTGETISRTMEIWQRGTQERLVRMTAPARLAGVSLLVTEDGTVHSYLPAYRRTRRVIGEQRGDAFMGTDFSMEDLSRLGFADEFSAEITGDGADNTDLLLSPTDPDAHRFAQLRLSVDDNTHIPARIEHLDEDGTVQRRLTLGDVQEVGGHPFAHRIELEDLDRDRRCVAVVKSITVNAGLGPEQFTVHALTR